MDFKDLGDPHGWYKNEPKVPDRVWALYRIYSELLSDLSEKESIKSTDILRLAGRVDYEPDKAVFVIKSADRHYHKLCADKIRRSAKP
jgi:hypothetical protein